MHISHINRLRSSPESSKRFPLTLYHFLFNEHTLIQTGVLSFGWVSCSYGPVNDIEVLALFYNQAL